MSEVWKEVGRRTWVGWGLRSGLELLKSTPHADDGTKPCELFETKAEAERAAWVHAMHNAWHDLGDTVEETPQRRRVTLIVEEDVLARKTQEQAPTAEALLKAALGVLAGAELDMCPRQMFGPDACSDSGCCKDDRRSKSPQCWRALLEEHVNAQEVSDGEHQGDGN